MRRKDLYTLAALSIVFLALAVVPTLLNLRFIMFILTLTNIFALLAVSWNLLSGYMGLLSLGHSFFFAGGGYAAAILTLSFGVPAPLAMLIGAVIITGIGCLIGLPSLKLRGHFFALVTLIIPIIAYQITNALPQLGGHDGIFGIPPLSSDANLVYLGSLLLVVFGVLVSYVVVGSRLGIIFTCIKDDETASMAAGIDVPRYKLYCLAISIFLAGLAGGFYAYLNGVVSPATYELEKASLPVLMTLLGGRATILGPVVGSYIVETIIESLKVEILVRSRLLIYSMLALTIFMVFPSGIVGYIRRRFYADTQS
ncbi:MAG: branched-chain amino acid ABC transporter permease [Candidatus Caldarchaeum sp.]|nr:branched-chain amino acid ABC transporter permease [Candidatus Caldarchaeum sp.]MDW7978888.1 branched-chain amino acid ABC transporter permease [Candidatus Caldarchaeum sp.]MDW8360412.1 branched-chain amino acid ABC transporter permease [Candidatus Caldarchaeum sp.]